jgi:hypothetical protein
MEYEQERLWLFEWLPQEHAVRPLMNFMLAEHGWRNPVRLISRDYLGIGTVRTHDSPLARLTAHMREPAGPDYFPAPATPPDPVAVMVSRNDLQYLLAHVSDEIHGAPDHRHWELPVLKDTIARLSLAAHTPMPGEGEDDDSTG